MWTFSRALGLLFFLAILGSAHQLSTAANPDVKDYRYGPHERNVLDLWQAKSAEPAPLLAFFHGGGFDHGDKSEIGSWIIEPMLDAGISVMSANYRLTPEARYPEHYYDCARAVQTARLKHKEWNLDPDRIAASGISAGGVVSLWLAFHDDLADPESTDPALRESTRLRCAVVFNTPANLDPRVMRQLIGETALNHRFFRGAFFGLTPDEAKRPEGLRLFVEASPISYLSSDDPPVYAFHHGPKDVPRDISVNDAVHHYNSGANLKQKMDALKLKCVLVNIHDLEGGGDSGLLPFLTEHLAKTANPNAASSAVSTKR
jgi:acetyl esterase/lipase